MTRKGWNWREEPEDVTPETVTEIIKIHNFNNEKAWNEVNCGLFTILTSCLAFERLDFRLSVLAALKLNLNRQLHPDSAMGGVPL